jgi:drug/metabolite transporter (DMT)-like permease
MTAPAGGAAPAARARRHGGAASRADNLRGAALMVAAMAAFAVEDMFLKAAAASLPVGVVLMLFGAGGAVGFAALALARGEPLWHPAMASRGVALRAAAEVTGRLGYTLAIVLTPLSAATAILQATPLVVVAGAALFFGERVGWRRWSAILAGFVGVMVILQPAPGSFVPASIFAVIGMAGFAARDLATRAAPRALSNRQLGLCGFVVLVPTGAALWAWTGGAVPADVRAFGYLAAGTVVGVAAYSGLTAAMRVGDVSVVTPFRYSRLLFGMGLGVVVFGESLSPTTLLGSAIVLAAGLYTLARAGRRAESP